MALSTKSLARLCAPLLCAALIVGCDANSVLSLSRAKSGARCSKVGAFARDNTNVLQCSKRKRWTVNMSISRAIEMIDAYNAAEAAKLAGPPPSPTAPPTDPTVSPTPWLAPLTQFSAGSVRVGNGGGWLVPGVYTTTVAPGSSCTVVRLNLDGSSALLNSFGPGPAFFEARTETLLTAGAGCTWYQAPSTPVTSALTGDGMYRVGIEIPAGFYRVAASAPGSLPCLWKRHASLDGTGGLNDSYSGTEPQVIIVVEGDKALSVSHCGTLVRENEPASNRFEVAGNPTDWLSQGVRFSYAGSSFTRTGTVNGSGRERLTVQTPTGWVATLDLPTNGSIPSGAFNVTATATATTPGFRLSAPGRVCLINQVALVVSNIHLSPAGRIDGLSLGFVQICNGGPAIPGTIAITPP
ncbi:MAG TPA: hypothetical protein DEG43_08455 [Acidimicrobiaceae bacterium]|nr:hypothetical protein [Acidimicrobiaceae bacterium]